jgi:transposase-like protein
VTLHRWVQRFTPLLRRGPAIPAPGRGSLVRRRDLGEGLRAWFYVYRAVNQHGQVIDEYVSRRRAIGSVPLMRQVPECELRVAGW